MKKLLHFSSLCILAGLLLSSCSSNVSIAKRHYRSGYYVDFSKKAPSVNYASAKPERKAVLAPIASPELPGIPEQYASAGTQLNTTLIDIPANKKAPLKVRHSVANAMQMLTQPLTVAKSATQAIQNTPVFSYDGSAGDDAAGAALSLLWIVIVVILIIWLLGLVAGGWGLGGLINLLLLIAVILLILWLLRIA